MSSRQTHPLSECASCFQPLYHNHCVNLQHLSSEAVIPLQGDISTNIHQVSLDQIEVTINNDWNRRRRRDTLRIQMMSATRFAEIRERNRILRRAEGLITYVPMSNTENVEDLGTSITSSCSHVQSKGKCAGMRLEDLSRDLLGVLEISLFSSSAAAL